MKRSIETIRYILPRLARFENKTMTDEYAYHMKLLVNANLVTAQSFHGDGEIIYTQLELTSTGMDLISSIGSQPVWDATVKKIEDAELDVNDIPITVVTQVADKVMLDMIYRVE